MKKSATRGARAKFAQAITKFKPDVRVDREEWDFSQCPEDQLQACFFYEFARECPHVVRVARALRMYLQETGADIAPDNRLAVTVVDIFKDCPEFPDTPFLRIPKAERTQRIARLNKPVPPLQADLSGLIRQNAKKALRGEMRGKTLPYLNGQGEIAAFFIDWRISDEKLAQGFRRWFKGNRPVGTVATVRKGKGSSHEQIRKDLKALGAWRLLKLMRWEDAYTYTREILKNTRSQPQGLFGSHANAWRRAQKVAKKTIKDVCAFLERLT